MTKRVYTIRVIVDHDDDVLQRRKPDHMKFMPNGTRVDIHKRRLREKQQRERSQQISRTIDGAVIREHT